MQHNPLHTQTAPPHTHFSWTLPLGQPKSICLSYALSMCSKLWHTAATARKINLRSEILQHKKLCHLCLCLQSTVAQIAGHSTRDREVLGSILARSLYNLDSNIHHIVCVYSWLKTMSCRAELRS